MMASMELAAEDAGLQKEVQPVASRSPLAAITNQAKLASSLVSKTPAESPFPPAWQTSHEVVTVDTYVAECEARGETQEKQGPGAEIKSAPESPVKAGLETGDIVVLSQENGWLGFRSASADGRFLQVRRKGTSRLVFFSANFGIWEQWELVEGNISQPWNRQRMGFRSRNLPQFVLTVDVQRIGRLATTSIVPHQMAAGEGDLSEHAELQKISNLLITEWSQFVAREKKVRIRIEGRVSKLVDEAAELKSWTRNQVQAVRQAMHNDMTQLATIARQQAAQAAESETRLTKSIRWGVRVLQRAEDANAMRVVFSHWRKAARHQRHCAAQVVRQLARSNERRCRAALAVWADHIADKTAMRARLCTAVHRLALLRLGTAFSSWARYAEAKRLRCMHLEGLLRRALAKAQHRALQAAFCAWTEVAAASAERQRLGEIMAARQRQSHVRSVFSAWQQEARELQRIRQLLAKAVHARAGRAMSISFSSWRSSVQESREREAMAGDYFVRQRQEFMAAVLHGWAQAAADGRRLRGLLTKALYRAVQRRCCAVLQEWQAVAVQSRRRRWALTKALDRLAYKRMEEAFDGWRSRAELTKHCMLLGQERRARAARSTLSSSFKAWQDLAEDQRLQMAACHRGRLKRIKSAAWRGWRRAVEHQKERAALVHGCREAHCRRVLAASLAALQQAADLGKAADEYASRFSQQRHRRESIALQGLAWGHWLEMVERRRRLERLLARCMARHSHMLLTTALTEWRHVAEQRRAFRGHLIAMANRADASLLKSAFTGWLDAHASKQQQQDAICRSVTQLSQRHLAAAFSGWREHASEAAALRQQLQRVVQRLAMLRAGAAFLAWQQSAQQGTALKACLKKAVQRVAACRMAAVMHAWHCKAANAAAVRRRVHRLQAAVHSRRVALVMRLWYGHTKDMAHARRLADQAALDCSSILAREVLKEWQARTAIKAGLRSSAVHVQRQIKSLRKSKVFGAWAEHVRDRRNSRTIAHSIGAQVQQRSLTRVLDAWRAHVGDVSWRRSAAEDQGNAVFQRLLRQNQLACFKAWGEAVECRKAGRARLGAFAATVMLSDTRARPSGHAPVATHSAALLLSAFASWREHCQEQRRHRIILARCLDKVVARLQWNALQAWRAATDAARIRAVALSRHRARCDVACQQRAFAKWRAVYEEQRDIYARLKACITRQRISFRLFKQWYWESFDEDVQNTLRHLYSTTEDSMNSPLASSVSPYSPFVEGVPGQPNWAVLDTPDSEQPRLTGSLDAAAFANPLSSLRRSTDRRNSDLQLQRNSPLPGGFIGAALAQYARDNASVNGSTASASPCATAAEQPAEAESDGWLVEELPGVNDVATVISEPEVPAANVEQDLMLHEVTDRWAAVQSVREAATEPARMKRATEHQPEREQTGTPEAEGSISFADAFGCTESDKGVADDASWGLGQEEGSVSFGLNLAGSGTPAETPPFCPQQSNGMQEAMHFAGEYQSAGQDNAGMPTPGPSSAGSAATDTRGGFMAAAAGTPPSTRHSFGPAEAIRSMSALPDSPQPRPAARCVTWPEPARLSFRQAHGLINPAMPLRSSRLGQETAPTHGGGPEPDECTHVEVSAGAPQQWMVAAKEEGDLVVYDEASMAAVGSPSLSANLQHIFDEALAHVGSAGTSPTPSCPDPSALDPTHLPSETAAPTAALTGSADEGEVELSAGDSLSKEASRASSPSLSCYSELSSPGCTDGASPQADASSTRMLVLDNPLSAAVSAGGSDISDDISRDVITGVASIAGGNDISRDVSTAVAAAVGRSPDALLLQMANPRRSLQSALSLAASLGSGILGAAQHSPFSGAEPDAGHIASSPVAGTAGALDNATTFFNPSFLAFEEEANNPEERTDKSSS
ncbi:g6588 [Coccomyxa elongata]